ncbi:MAG: AsmA-like C-terminal region-containing protein [Acidobacteriota bacterium]
MPPAARRLLLVAAVFVGVLAALLLALPYVVSLDAMRARILAAAETALHRKVEAGAIRLEIFSGLGARIESFAVRNGAGWESPSLVSADRLSVKVAFWPLLSRRVEVRRVILDGVTVSVERDPGGALNIDDFLPKAPAGAKQGGKPPAAAPLVSRIQISRGRFLFVDRKVSPNQTVTTSLDDLTGEITGGGPGPAARFDLSARFLADTGRNLSLKGSLGPAPPGGEPGQVPLRAAFEARRLALSRLGPYLGAPKETDPGVFSAEGAVEGAFPGPLKLASNLSLLPPSPSSTIPPIEGKVALTLDWPGGALVIAKSPLAVAKLPLTMEGRIDGLRASPRVALRLATAGDVPLDGVTGLPGLSGALPAGAKLSGRVRLEAGIEGPSSDLEVRASVDAAPIGVLLSGQPLFAAPAARATLAARGKGPVSGRVTAPSGRLQKLPFENLAADWTWDRGALTVSPALRAFGGTVGARLETDFARPKSESRVLLEVRGVQAQPLVESLTSARNVLFGAMTAKLALASPGLTWDAVSRAARGEGRLSIANAELRTLDLMPAVARSLEAVGAVAGFRVPPSLESARFSGLDTALRLADGRLATPGLSLSGRDVSATADGSLGLDRSLSYEGRVTLGPALVKSLGSAGRYLADERGSLSLPFRVSGQVAAPKVSIDERVVLDLGRRVLAREARERLQGGVGKAVGDALEGSGGQKTDPLDILQRLLERPSPTPTPRRPGAR